MNKSVKTLVISLLLIITLPMTKLSAQVSVWDGTWEPWGHGTGMEGDPFLIENAQQLAYLAYRVNNGLDAGGGHVSNHDYHYKMMIDIDLNGSEDFQWTPIGYWNSDTDYQCFGGHFDGNNHGIYGLYTLNHLECVGLFGCIANANIDNSIVFGQFARNSVLVSSGPRGCFGGIAGYSIGASLISNCENHCKVFCSIGSGSGGDGDKYTYAGGIVGYCEGSSIINNCKNHCRVDSDNSWGHYGTTAFAGGIVGYCKSSTIIDNCQNFDTISTYTIAGDVFSCSGGIAGSGGVISNCANYGCIMSYTNDAKNSSIAKSGGIVGQNGRAFYCYNNGEVRSQAGGRREARSFSGGIIGDGGSARFCYNIGTVSSVGYPESGYSYAGGINANNGTINNCYNTGDINSVGYFNYTGGIIGYSGSVSNSYYLNTCGGDNTYGGISTFSSYMQTEEFVTLLNDGSCEIFVQDVMPNVNDGYPLLTMMMDCAYTSSATDLTLTDVSATLNGFIDAVYINYTKGFEYRKVGEQTYTTIHVTEGNNNYSYRLSGLEPNITYEYRSFAYFPSCDYTAYGNVKTFEISWLTMDTICIYDADMLRWVSEQCNNGITFEGKYVKLMNDITLPLNVPNNMTSIGVYPNYPFKGTFDGNGKLIYNLYIDKPNTPYQGFFGYTLNANLYNVGLVNITASGRNYTGGMVAYAENTHLRDCYVNGGTLFALSYCGGLIGYQEQGTNSIVSGCYNTCSVSGNHYVGGLIGFSNYSTVRNSYVAGPVSGQGNGIGAIIGGANEVLMYYCYFSTEMTGQTNAIGENNIGGGKDGGEGLTNAQMRDPQFVATLNRGLMTPVWMADYASHINNGFPIIKWQRPGTGVEENNVVKNYVSLYPNPANGFVTIQSDEPSISLKYMEVYDVIGKKVMSGLLDGQSQQLSLAKLLSGVYHIRIQTSNGCYTHLKLVVQ